MNKIDIAIIGGGASGICSAISAKMTNPSLNIVILEKQSRIGKKILATGNGRCNLGNKNISESKFHGSIRNYMNIIDKTIDTEEFFNSLGVVCTVDNEGRMYPYSNHASAILNALRIKLEQLDIEIICDFNVTEINGSRNKFKIKSENTIIESKSIIICSGGYASPSLGTDGSVIKLLRNMGHKIAKIHPAIAPLKVDIKSIKGLKGIRTRAMVTAKSNGKLLKSELGEVQFTENTISGICVFNLAYLQRDYEKDFCIEIDLMPDYSYPEIISKLKLIKKIRNNQILEEFLTGIFQKNMANFIIKKSVDLPMNSSINSLKEDNLKKIATLIKKMEFKISGTSSWNNAQTTLGGVDGRCVDKSLQSNIVDGLYFAGEVLDIAGDCGGYNLTWAWSSGIWSGNKCAESMGK